MLKLLKKHKTFLVSLFIGAFFLRAAVFWGYLSKDDRYWQVDSQTYHAVAKSIAHGEGISLEGCPHFYRLPGYPFFLALYYFLVEVNTKNVLWPQVFVASCIPVFIFLLSCFLFPGALMAARVASLYSAIHIGFVLYSGFFMTESFFILFFLLFLLFFLRSTHFFFCRYKIIDEVHAYATCPFSSFIPDPVASGQEYIRFYEKNLARDFSRFKELSLEGRADMKQLVMAGIFLGIASLFRPVGHYLVILALIILVVARDTWYEKLTKGTILFFSWLVPVSFWLLRNFMLTGYLFFHTLPGGHFLYLSAARVAMHVQKCSYQDARKNLYKEVHENIDKKAKNLGRSLQEIEICHEHEKLAIAYFKKYPFIAAKNWCLDMFRTMFSLYTAELVYLESGRAEVDYFKKGRSVQEMFMRYLVPEHVPLWLKLLVWFEIFLFLMVLIGFIGYCISAAMLRSHNLCVAVAAVLFIGLFIVLALSGGYARMRLPAEPLIIILSVWWWGNFWQRREMKIR